jgi:chorismate synthase
LKCRPAGLNVVKEDIAHMIKERMKAYLKCLYPKRDTDEMIIMRKVLPYKAKARN